MQNNDVTSSQIKSPFSLTLQTAPQAAAQAIREAIISGELKGGDRILEQKWSRRLGIGQPTLREALQELEHQGLLRRLHQRGTYVSQLSLEDYRLIQEVRIPLEAIAVGKAAQNLSPQSDQELTSLVITMANSGNDVANVKIFHDADVAFHRKVWSLAKNQYLRDTLETITVRLFVFSIVGRWPDTPNAKQERQAAVKQHLGILEGIKSRDAKVASRRFIEETVRYWNSQYSLQLSEEEMLAANVWPLNPQDHEQ
jgi:DNA-binding GntR family transcriptional regulator